MSVLPLTTLTLNNDICFQQIWKICPACWCVSPATPYYCARCLTSLTTYQSYTLAGIGRIWGVSGCLSCSTFCAAHLARCPVCTGTLLTIVKPVASQSYPFFTPSCSGCIQAQTNKLPFCGTCGKMHRYVTSYITDRPTLHLSVKARETQLEIAFDVLVDSGACYNVFHSLYAGLLGISLSNAKPMTFSGITPNTTIIGYETVVELGIGGKFYETVVYFSYELPPTCDSMLGKVGFLDRFIVEINDANKSLTLQEADVLSQRKSLVCFACKAHNQQTSHYCQYCGASLYASPTHNGYLTIAGPSLPPPRT